MPHRGNALTALAALIIAVCAARPAGALPIGPPGGGIDPACSQSSDCDDGDPCTVGELCQNPGSDNAICLGPTDNICPTTTTTSSSSTSTSSSTTTQPTLQATTSTTTATGGTTSTTTAAGGTTSTTIPAGLCAPGDACDDGDPCTGDACVDATCVHTPAAHLAAAICVCDRALPEACPATMPRAVAKPLTRACELARKADAAGSAAKKKVFVRAAAKFKATGARAAKLKTKGALDPACADVLAAGAQQAQQGVATAQQAH